MKNAFVIAAVSSGCGKTTLSLGLMRALIRKGKSVQPFKCGPDYIDTQYHRIATGKDSINLDLFMSSECHVRSLFDGYSSAAEISIIEGAMGMFDGFDRMRGSAADIACRLEVPVILLINAASTAYSVVATIYGFTHLNPKVRVAGVVFNRVGSENHFLFLQEACNAVGVRCFGYIRKNEELQTPSRHLGLSLESVSEISRFIEIAASEVESTVDIDGIMDATTVMPRKTAMEPRSLCKITVAVARDEAFSFIYRANLEALHARIVYFSPLHDNVLPTADIVYLPGGYPELYGDELEKNQAMREEVKRYAEEGGRILAECGGMIYLTEEIDGKKMCGVLPLRTTMRNARLRLGYRKVTFGDFAVCGHEFHYSTVIDSAVLPSCAVQYDIHGKEVGTPVYRYKNVIAGYTHLYWAETDLYRLWEI